MQTTQHKQTMLRAFNTLIEGIAFNNVHGDDPLCSDHKSLTHKEVRNIAKSAIVNEITSYFQRNIGDQIEFFLWSLTRYGLSHVERSFTAKQILELIKEQEHRDSLDETEVNCF